MTTKKYFTQAKKKDFWNNENGLQVPLKRISKAERLTERKTEQIVKKAIDLNKRLTEFKSFLKDNAQEIYQAFLKENGIEPKVNYKGNFTFYNFDRSVKIEVNISEPIEFDDITIQAAQQKLQEFLRKRIVTDDDLIKEVIVDSFKTRRGKLDPNRVLALTSWVNKINDTLFTEAVALINKSIRRKKSKTYYKVYIKDNEGQYKSIELNFSNVKTAGKDEPKN